MAEKGKKKKLTRKKKEVVAAELAPPTEVKVEVPPPPPVEPKKEKAPKGPRYYGTGRRKEAIAKVWLKSGTGKIVLNGRSIEQYFCGRRLLEYQVKRPLVVTNTQQNYDVFAKAYGGGISGQAGAISLGIARALIEVNPDFRSQLKEQGLLRRDPRMKERKKYGLKRARRAFQYTKR